MCEMAFDCMYADKEGKNRLKIMLFRNVNSGLCKKCWKWDLILFLLDVRHSKFALNHNLWCQWILQFDVDQRVAWAMAFITFLDWQIDSFFGKIPKVPMCDNQANEAVLIQEVHFWFVMRLCCLLLLTPTGFAFSWAATKWAWTWTAES